MSNLTSNVNNYVHSVFDSKAQALIPSMFNDINNSACRKRRHHRKRSRSRKRKRARRSRSRKRRRRSRSRKRRRRSRSRKRRRRSRSRKRSGSRKRCGPKRHKRSRSVSKCGGRRGCVWRESHYPKFKQPSCCKQKLKYKISPFSLWVQKNMKSLKGKGDASQIMRALAKSWKCLTPMDKAKFYQQAAGSKKKKCS